MNIKNEENTIKYEKLSYRGKHFVLPILSKEGFEIIGNSNKNLGIIPTKEESPIIADLNSIWNLDKFMIPRKPLTVGKLSGEEIKVFSQENVPRVLDMPIKFPSSNFKVPKSLSNLKQQ